MIITVATGPYAHTASLADHNDHELEIRHEAIEPGKIFGRMLRDRCWDVAEMSLASIYMLSDAGDQRFAALPVFTSRAFRHSALYVPINSSISHPRDLEGRTFGVLRYSMTGAIYVRALLAEQYGVRVETLAWVVGDDSAQPVGVKLRRVDGLPALDQLAASGEIDCLVSGRVPPSFLTGKLRRLFPEFGVEEKAAFQSNGIFPIMHALVARREVVQERPDIVRLLLTRFESAKTNAEANLRNLDFSVYPLPWLAAYVDDAVRHMGPALWPYGVPQNRRTLSDFARLMAQQGLTGRVLSPESVFEFS
ncbi:MAG TPA: hypothetical protein VFA81_13235 [Burkholderiales bacterium]|nr:hypothetical protein [Burkholderiales bacterium]